MSIEKRSLRKTQIDSIIDYVMNESVNYDDIILHEEFEKLIDVSSGTTEYYSIIGEANKELTLRGKRLESEYQKGYNVLKPKFYGHSASKQIDSGKRKMKKGCTIITSTPLQHLDNFTKGIYKEASARMLAFYSNVDKKHTTLKTILDRMPKKTRLTTSERINPLINHSEDENVKETVPENI